MSTPHTIRVDGVTYEAVTDLDGKALPAPVLKEPWWYRLVPFGGCTDTPLSPDAYWYERREAKRRAKWRRKGWIMVQT